MTDRSVNSSDPLDRDLTRAQPSVSPATETIGPYRLLERVGEGGMGEVWLAEQTRPVHRQVALKVIKAGMDTVQVVARFEAERQALALMEHPAIARVFDAGATPQGRPYFAMEYVRGEAITTYADRHKLAIPDRIALFLGVCEGVQHAHQKGIIHRDLKPSNVLVAVRDDHPVPKIIDFGVAKATTQALTDRTLHTELGVLIGTPEYMSPEQAEMSALDIDTRTDVYALGVMLYELLTGTLPFESKALREKSLDEIRRTVREVDPPRPSTRVTTTAASADAASPRRVAATRLASQLRGDLDWITMKTLEKDRTRRYATVGELAADLRRHLENLPVLASPPSTMYRLRKFGRRHRVAVGAAATLVMLLIAFATTMAIQARRIARERDRANVEAESAKQVSDFLVGLFAVSDPNEARGSTLTAREILDKGAQHIDQTLTGQPRVQARLKATMGEVYTNLGLYQAAEPLIRQAVDVQQRSLGSDHVETMDSMHALANLYWWEERYSDAEPLYLALLESRRRLYGERHPDTLRTAYDLGSLYLVQKRWNEAEQLMRKTLEIQRRILGANHLDTLASSNNLASLYWRQKRYGEAEPLYVEALAVRRRQLGDNHPETLASAHNLATTYDMLGRYGEAEPLYLTTLATKRRVLSDSHPLTILTARRLAAMYQTNKRYTEAESLLLDAARALNLDAADTARQGGTAVQVQGAAVDVVSQLAGLYGDWGKRDKAAEWQAKLPKQPSPKP
jgi:serine/threonine protein kinase/tetratricopeptide (TPR) repeat protein